MLGWLKRLLRKKETPVPVMCKVQDFPMISIYPENPIDRLSPYELHKKEQYRAAHIKEEYASWIANCKAVNELLNRQNTSRKHLRLVA